MPSTMSCVVCENKSINGVFKCEGCSLTFCLKHTNEHRQYLSHKLNEIIHEHENIYHIFSENKQSSLLFDQINQWEKDSIIKIQKTAQNARIQIEQFAKLQKEHSKEKYNQISQQLENARQKHEYLEKDLYRWKILLEQFKYDLTILSPSIILHQDHNQTLINNISILKMDQQSILNETLISFSNEIQFDNNHHIAMHCGPYRTPAYISGTQEYSLGQHQIRLFISKMTHEFILSFNIMSKLMSLSSNLSDSDSKYLTYGWQSDDCVNPSQCILSGTKNCRDLKGKTKFYITLFIDCDKQKINYFNEKTKQRREINVDIETCPLPWKLYFYLYDVGDSVRLLSSSQIS
ncbi:unnamed protein product [Rotaria sp. Silwood2]|nr:unnamed protein product [Rotaria sp. Silwood2]CAF2807623.1 unnamed protein product [Rotaria sp. Silwood2]CAF3192324.1 unnamed protein product [Rotaria sp. Silwood2]CAF4371367.1 unnamed protein product [Rotaria sp. Silwood2]CAF4373348.1 unnamed protein product [Rotaria sp. Silwood2]